jgi:hypothetical protein
MYLLPTYNLVKDSKCHFNKREGSKISSKKQALSVKMISNKYFWDVQ